MIYLVGTTRNNMTVNVDLAFSAAAKQISRNPHLLEMAGEALRLLPVNGLSAVLTYNMGRTIGYDFVVEAGEDSSVFYAQVVKEEFYRPFTKKGDPKATRLLTLSLVYDATEKLYILSDIWLGANRPAHPGDELANDQSISFWQTHAHIYCEQALKPSSITHTCPY